MRDAKSQGFQDIQNLLRYGAEMSFSLSDEDLGHGLIDLARTARKEIAQIGLKGGLTEVPVDSYEGVLLYRLMPEMSRRLIARSGAQLLLLKGERPGGDVTNIPEDRLRRYVGHCLDQSAFSMIAEKVRDRFDPDYQMRSTFFANEAIERDCRKGNILEVALSRIADPLIHLDTGDIISDRIRTWTSSLSSTPETGSWNPDLPNFHDENQPEVSASLEEEGGVLTL